MPAQDNKGWVDFTDIPYVTPANDNIPTKNGLFGRVGAALRRLRALRRFNWPFWDTMTKVVRVSQQAASQDLIARLVKSGYLEPALRNDPDAITIAIAGLKEDLRGGGHDRAAENSAQLLPKRLTPCFTKTTWNILRNSRDLFADA